MLTLRVKYKVFAKKPIFVLRLKLGPTLDCGGHSQASADLEIVRSQPIVAQHVKATANQIGESGAQ